MSKLDRFMLVYEKHLKDCVSKYPSEYAWNIADLPLVVGRMYDAIVGGTFSKDSIAFKLTCKELGIKHTYKAIAEYIKEVN